MASGDFLQSFMIRSYPCSITIHMIPIRSNRIYKKCSIGTRIVPDTVDCKPPGLRISIGI